LSHHWIVLRDGLHYPLVKDRFLSDSKGEAATRAFDGAIRPTCDKSAQALDDAAKVVLSEFNAKIARVGV
jgi:hypothetical protein